MVDVRKIVVYIATSADGYIARLDGDVGVARSAATERQLRIRRVRRKHRHDSLSRKTCDKGVDMGMKSGAFGHRVKPMWCLPSPRPVTF